MKRALLIIDPLNDFCPGGALALEEGDAIMPVINRLAHQGPYERVVLIQESHPPGHISFASRHGKEPFQEIELPGGRRQMLWPDHCVEGTSGAEPHPELEKKLLTDRVLKGRKRDVENYSAFEDDDGEDTGLTPLLLRHGIDSVDIVGLATDYCVQWSARHALLPPRNLETRIVREATRAIADREKALNELAAAGATIVSVDDVLGQY